MTSHPLGEFPRRRMRRLRGSETLRAMVAEWSSLGTTSSSRCS